MSIICQIYRSKKEEGMYLYTKKSQGLVDVPEVLLKRFGVPEPAMVLNLTPEKKLARADCKKVMAALDGAGYYLQMPPSLIKDAAVESVMQHNSKL